MAVVTEIRDDLTQEPGAVARPFSIGGTSYTVDLTDGSHKDMLDLLAPYLAVASVVETLGLAVSKSRRQPRGTGTPVSSTQKEHYAAVRAWARLNGVDVNDRGRIRTAVFEAYDKANSPQSPDSSVVRVVDDPVIAAPYAA